MSQQHPGTAAPHAPRMGRLAAAAVFATALEWFDFLIYATAAALVLGHQFSPTSARRWARWRPSPPSPSASSPVRWAASSPGTSATGSAASRRRPGDGGRHARHRRAAQLRPHRAWAPILLVVLRLVQGLGVGAQWGGAALLLTEHAPVERRGFYGSLIQTGAIFGSVAGSALFWLIGTGSVALVLLSLLIGFTIHATMYGSQAALYAEMFPADVRYSGASLGHQFASVFAGGLAPFIMAALLTATGGAWSVSLYIVATAVVTFVSVFTIKKRFRRDLSETSRDVAPARVGALAG